jgi:hypothetical protein
MTLAQFGPLFPAVITPLMIALGGWNMWRLKHLYRARCRRMVEHRLATLGETPVAIKEIPRAAFYETAGLSAAVIFEVRARAADGDERTYQWGYAPRSFSRRTEGLQRLAHGIWIALA